ncbi:trypsin-like peptidase domain-containing protein [Immundisolibacter sp.]|uniref:trypsin-like peptidase domain-containing protein n=1 Tax=Immundisolibacter sp. TaxID=1934948 RepID=UPI00356644ED
MIEPLLLTTVQVSTFDGERSLSGASGFFFERDGRVFLATSRHVVIDAPSGHVPSHLRIEYHNNPQNLAQSTVLSVPLYNDGAPLWRQGTDGGGEVDVAAIELDRQALGADAPLCAFTPDHLQDSLADIEVGTSVLVVGFPLGFHDTLHHLPVARRAGIASAFGLRFQGQGYFLTDGRTHRGISGAPVVMRRPDDGSPLPWALLGVHSARMDIGSRDLQLDESLGLNCAWYADILLTLTEPAAP